VVLRLLRGEDLGEVSREVQVSPSELEEWRRVFLVLTASALAAFVAPVIFYLNFRYCLLIIPREDRAFYPSTFARRFGWTSIVVFTAMTLIAIYWTILVPILGG
jgi:hypothetical protein